MRIAIAAALIVMASSASAETLAYGSRAGMEVTVVKKSNIGSTHASIDVKHTKANATAFCREYVGKVTPKCVADELKVGLLPTISANCKTGKFSTLDSQGFTFFGPNPNYDPNYELTQTEYLLKRVPSGEQVGGSMADGYDVALLQFRALCPNRFK